MPPAQFAQIPVNLKTISQRLLADLPRAHVYLVGGAVRDLILKRPTKDYDLVVGGAPIPKLERWLAGHGQVNLVGKNFGVFKWQPAGWSGEPIDVALPRTEHVFAGSGQYRDFKIQSNPDLPIADDLMRRDFTINAIALDLENYSLIDPAHGLTDLKKKNIRSVGDPKKRFNEDLSRTLRAIRQACQLNFKIETATLKGISSLSKKAATGKRAGDWLVPREIIARELLKALQANPVMAMELFDKVGFIKHLLTEIEALKGVPQPPQFHSEGDVWVHTKLALGSFESPEWIKFFGLAHPSLNVILGTLLHDIGKPSTLKTPKKDKVDRIRTDGHDVVGAKMVPDICQRLRLTSYTHPEAGQINIDDVAWLVKSHLLLAHGSPEIFKPATIYRYFLKNPKLGLELRQLIFADMYATKPTDGRLLTPKLHDLDARIKEVGKKLTAGKLKLLLSGEEIMANFKLNPGPKIGSLLQLLEEAQLSNVVKNKRQAFNYLKKQL